MLISHLLYAHFFVSLLREKGGCGMRVCKSGHWVCVKICSFLIYYMLISLLISDHGEGRVWNGVWCIYVREFSVCGVLRRVKAWEGGLGNKGKIGMEKRLVMREFASLWYQNLFRGYEHICACCCWCQGRKTFNEWDCRLSIHLNKNTRRHYCLSC